MLSSLYVLICPLAHAFATVLANDRRLHFTAVRDAVLLVFQRGSLRNIPVGDRSVGAAGLEAIAVVLLLTTSEG